MTAFAPDQLITLDQAAGLIPGADDVIPSPWRPRNQPVPVSTVCRIITG